MSDEPCVCGTEFTCIADEHAEPRDELLADIASFNEVLDGREQAVDEVESEVERLRAEVESLNREVMRHQVGEGYEAGYAHGVLAVQQERADLWEGQGMADRLDAIRRRVPRLAEFRYRTLRDDVMWLIEELDLTRRSLKVMLRQNLRAYEPVYRRFHTAARLDEIRSEVHVDNLYQAWCVIANARDWHVDDEQADEWRVAAERWRDEVFHPTLAAVASVETETGEEPKP